MLGNGDSVCCRAIGSETQIESVCVEIFLYVGFGQHFAEGAKKVVDTKNIYLNFVNLLWN